MLFGNSDILTIVGWVVTFILGVISTIITQSFTREKKFLKWAIVSEIDLSPTHHLKAAPSVPIKILVKGIEARSVHSVQLQIVSSGNKEIQDVEVQVGFGLSATLMSFSTDEDLGAWSQHVVLENDSKNGLIKLKHINPGQRLTLNALVKDYKTGDATIDVAAPGVAIRQSSVVDISLVGGVLKTASFSLMGVRLDPQVSQTALLVGEVRRLRETVALAIEERAGKP